MFFHSSRGLSWLTKLFDPLLAVAASRKHLTGVLR